MATPTENYADFVEAEVSGLGRIKVPLKGHTPAERKRALARVQGIVPADVEHIVIHGDDGKPTTIVRGPLSDAEWKAVKEAAQKKERAFKESVHDEESASAKPEGTTPMAKAAAIVGDMATGNTSRPMPVPLSSPMERLDAAAREAGDPVRDTSKPSTGGTTPMAKMAGLVGDAARVAVPGEGKMQLPEMDLTNEGKQKMPELDISGKGQLGQFKRSLSGKQPLPEMDLSSVGKMQLPEMDVSGRSQLFPTMDLTAYGAVPVLQPAGPATTREVADFEADLSNTASYTTPLSAVDPETMRLAMQEQPGLLAKMGNNLTKNLRGSDAYPDAGAGLQPAAASIAGLFRGTPEMMGVNPVTGQPYERAATPAQPVPNSSEPLSSSMPPEQVPASFQPMPAQPQPEPPPMPGSGGMGFSVKTKGGPGMPAAPGGDLEKKLAEAEGLALNAGILKAQVDNERLNQTVLERDRVMKAAAEQEQRRLAAENAMADHMKQGEFALNDLKQQVLDAGNQKIDPNRYWANKSDGQKFAAVLAGAAFGFTGQGMQWLQRLDGLVETDIRAQQADIANKRGSLNDAIGVQKNLIEMGRQRGLSAIESVNAARAAMYEDAAFRLEQIADTAAASDPARAANVLQMKADVLAKSAKAGEELFKTRMDAAYKMGSLALQQREMTWKEQMGAAGGGKPLPEAAVARLGGYVDNLRAITAMKNLAANEGVGDRIGQKAAQTWPFGYAGDKAKSEQYDKLKYGVATAVAKGALQAHEEARIMPLLGSRGQVGYDPVPNLEEAEREALVQLDNAIATHAAGSQEMAKYVQLRNELAAKVKPASFGTVRK